MRISNLLTRIDYSETERFLTVQEKDEPLKYWEKMKLIELSKKFLRCWETTDWDSFDELLAENVKLELTWLETTIEGEKNIKKLFQKTCTVDSKFEIDQIIGNEEHVVVTGISSRKVGIFGSPNIDIIEGNKVSGFEFCLLLEWQNNKLSNMYLNDCSVQTHETVMKEWIDQI